ncbi:hypothetical protein [Endozoicomonas elysicola]|nr:hypothetical protein [Endozoicomonas elysicola]
MANGQANISGIDHSDLIGRPSAVLVSKPVIVRARPSGVMGGNSVTQTLRKNTQGLSGSISNSRFSDRSVHLLNSFRQIWSRKELSDIDLISAFKLKLINQSLLDKYKNKVRGQDLVDLQDLKKKLNKKSYDEQLTKKQRKLFKRGRRLFRVNELSNRRLMQAIRYHLINNAFFSKKMNFQEPHRACLIKEIAKKIKECEKNEVRRYLFLSRSMVPDTQLIDRAIYIIKSCFVKSKVAQRFINKQLKKSSQGKSKHLLKRNLLSEKN